MAICGQVMWWWLGSVRRLGGPRCVAVKLKMECSGLWLKMARPRKFVRVHVNLYRFSFNHQVLYSRLNEAKEKYSDGWLCFWTSPSEFVIPLAKYYKAVYSNQIFLGMWFQMMFETKESGTRM
ncbi:putative auxin response factor [Helianthus anomalus]